MGKKYHSIRLISSDFRSIISTIFNAITFALLDAGIAMTDMVISCSVGRIHEDLYLDITQVTLDISILISLFQLEQSSGVYLPIALKASNDEIVYLQLDNRLSLAHLQSAIALAQSGCDEIRQLIENGMKEMMTDSLSLLSLNIASQSRSGVVVDKA